jgi:phenylacetic acid degradation operon negative regulatory protein
MHPRTRAKYGAISKLILKLIGTGLLTSLAGLSGSPTKTNRALKDLSDYSKEQIRRCLAHLRMQGYIQYTAEDHNAPLVITKNGLKRLHAQTVREKIIGTTKKRWDHLWRMVVFDIPETKKDYRDGFRSALLKLGFFPYQQSMYITPFACEKIIWEIARKYHIAKYILVSVTPNLGWRESYAISWFVNDIKI